MEFEIRPYYGHDCNSWDGFNDGYYLDPIIVDAPDADTARLIAFDQYIQTEPLPDGAELDNPHWELCVYWEFERSNCENPDDYLYAYIDFNASEAKEI